MKHVVILQSISALQDQALKHLHNQPTIDHLYSYKNKKNMDTHTYSCCYVLKMFRSVSDHKVRR